MALPISGLKLTYDEEFNSISYAGGAKMTTGDHTWNTTMSGGSRSLSGNNEEQIYIDPGYKGLGVNPFSVNNGVLTITAAPASSTVRSQTGYDYTSGALTTQNIFTQQYGYFEVRAKLPAGGQGLWPAFWMLPSGGNWPPELDILEAIGTAPWYLHQGYHSNYGNDGVGENTPNNNTRDFHTYGMDWNKDTVTFYYDGQARWTFDTPDDLHVPMFMVLNQAIGGNWAGSPDGTTDWSQANYQVDYVRAYEHGDPNAPITTPDPDPTATPDPDPAPTPSPVTNYGPGLSPYHVIMSNTMDVTDRSSTFSTESDVSRAYSASQMGIDDVESSTSVSVSYNGMRDITVTNNDAWGSIRNAILGSGDVRNVTINNFVDAEINLGDTPRVITVDDAKRGNIRTGAGSDTITVTAKSDTNDINVMNINANGGNNRVSFTGASNTRVNVTTGSGDDRISIQTSGASSATGGTGRDVFSFIANAHATITDFKSADDRIELSGVSANSVKVSASGGNTYIDMGSSGRITVADVTHTQAGLNLSYV
jgi:serralysin